MQALLDSVILPAAIQGALLAVALLVRPKNRVANRILAGLIAAVSLMLLLGVAERRWAVPSHPHLLGFTAPLPFLFGPLLYLYIVALTRPASRFELRWLAHFVPFAVAALYWTQTFYLLPGAEKLAVVRAFTAGELRAPLALRLLQMGLIAQAIAYLAASWLALRAWSRRIEGFFSELARIDLRWLKAMLLGHVAVWSIVIISGVLSIAGVAPVELRGFSRAIQLGSALLIFLTGYVSLWQVELFDKAQASRPLPKYQRNRLEDAEAAELAAKVLACMKERKPYRDASFTLQALADDVGTTPHTLSQVLNLHLRKNFFVLVNSYRAEDLKAALADPRQQHRGVFELALEAGFNSKSSLNSFFKRYTGLTPSEFRERHGARKTLQVSTS